MELRRGAAGLGLKSWSKRVGSRGMLGCRWVCRTDPRAETGEGYAWRIGLEWQTPGGARAGSSPIISGPGAAWAWRGRFRIEGGGLFGTMVVLRLVMPTRRIGGRCPKGERVVMKRLITAAAIAAWTGTAAAERGVWGVTSLHPAGATESRAMGVDASDGLVVVGYATIGGMDRASLWEGTAESWLDLNPPGATGSQATFTSSGLHVGYAMFGGVDHAVMWNAQTGAWVDLHPVGATASRATGVEGSIQAGFATVNGADHACFWHDTAESWIDLHPAGATRSRATAVAGETLVGFGTFDGFDHAGRWFDLAASWIDLHPVGATESRACGNVSTWYGSDQAGFATIGGIDHACIWSGPAGLWSDIQPTQATRSRVLTARRNQWSWLQAGFATFDGVDHAVVFHGGSFWFDLSAYLSGSWGDARAEGIWSEGATTYVVGWGHNNDTGRDEALLWSYESCSPCTADYDDNGGIDGSDLGAFYADFEAGAVCADLDYDGGITGADLAVFWSFFEYGGDC